MHIERNRINQALTEAEIQHLQQCEQCQNEQQLLVNLKLDALDLPLITPPAPSWKKIKTQMDQNNPQPGEQNVVQLSSHRRAPWQNITAIAATVMLTAFGWLLWNNYQLQGQLEQVLQVNQNLELQLDQQDMPGFRQARLLLEIRNIEQALDQANSKAVKINLLKQRQQLIADMVEEQKGEQHDFSI